MIRATLCFLVEEHPVPRVLLGRKKRGFGVGKLNGIGGKIAPGEKPEQAIQREVEEEIGVKIPPASLHNAGQITFRFPFRPEDDHEVHLFVASSWDGDPVETEEMAPRWVPTGDIPFAQMWQDDAYWLPLVLQGVRVHGEFVFGADNESVTEWSLRGAPTPRWKEAAR